MHTSVSSVWLQFNRELEGRVPFLYVDFRGVLSVGIGDILDVPPGPTESADEARTASLALAYRLHWLRADDTPAALEEVAAEWDRVRDQGHLALHGAGAFRPPVTTLHVATHEIDRYALERLPELERAVASRTEFSDYADWPADAQLGLLSIAFRWGTGFRAPRLAARLAEGDFAAAAAASELNPNVGNYVLRNERNRLLFANAAVVADSSLDPSVLVYPAAAVETAPPDPATQVVDDHLGSTPTPSARPSVPAEPRSRLWPTP